MYTLKKIACLANPGASNSIACGPHIILNTKLRCMSFLANTLELYCMWATHNSEYELELRVISGKYKLLSTLFRINTLQPYVIICTNSYKHVLKCSMHSNNTQSLFLHTVSIKTALKMKYIVFSVRYRQKSSCIM